MPNSQYGTAELLHYDSCVYICSLETSSLKIPKRGKPRGIRPGEIKVWKDLPMLLMATSPGGQGGASVLAAAKTGFPYMGGNVVADFSLPSFYDHFSNTGITNKELATRLDETVALFEKSLTQ